MTAPEIETPIYQEWQIARASSFLPHALIFPSMWLVFAPINAEVGLMLGILATGVSISIRLTLAKRIKVTREVLHVGKAAIPREFLGTVEVISAENQFNERGALLNSRAYLALKGLPGLVKIDNIDANDPTPYLLISTRRPEELKKALAC